jgi:hypothetical protein
MSYTGKTPVDYVDIMESQSLVVLNDLTVDTNTLYVDSTNNRVGIGTSLPASALDVTGTVTADTVTANIINVAPTTGYANIEIGGPSGAYIDLKSPFSDDYDGRIITNGTGLSITTGSGSGAVNLQHQNATKLTTTSTGINVTGTVTADGLTVDTNTLYVDSTNNRVGIGTSSPSQRLTVSSGTSSFPAVNLIGAGPNQGWLRLGNNADIKGGDDYLGMAFTVGASERMRIDSSGRVGIGTSSPEHALSVFKDSNGNRTEIGIDNIDQRLVLGAYFESGVGQYSTIQSTNNAETTATNLTLQPDGGNVGVGTSSPAGLLELSANNGTVADLSKSLRINNQSYAAGTYAGVLFQTADTLNSFITAERVASYAGILKFAVNAGSNANDLQERMRIDSSGNVGIGTSSVNSPSAGRTVLEVNGSSTALFHLGINGSAKGQLYHSGSEFRINSIGTDPMTFYANGSERMRIDSSGNVGVGTSSPSSKLHVASVITTSKTNLVRLNGSYVAGNLSHGIGFSINGNPASAGVYVTEANGLGSNLVFTTSPDFDAVTPTNTERMRIDSSGNVLVGGTDSGGRVSITRAGIVLRLNTPNTSNTAVQFVYNGSSQVGSITTTTTTTAYNSPSDYRLKEDMQPMTGAIERVNALNPVNFAWKVDGSRVDGFLAHEAQTVVPEAVAGEKDAVDADGNPEYQGIDQAKLVPLLTAALQEAITKIEDLEARVATLEGN